MNDKNKTIIIHQANSRGRADHGWLKAWHSFSFANYHNPERMGFGALRVINDDVIAAGKGFGTHSHNNMEIITIPLQGEVAHKDSGGNSGIIKPGEVQLMSAGSGIQHSEFNASSDNELNLFQIWIIPAIEDTPPSYQQAAFDWQAPGVNLIVSPAGKPGLNIQQQAFISIANAEEGETVDYQKHDPATGVFLMAVSGEITVNGYKLTARDSAAILPAEKDIEIKAADKAKFIIYEVKHPAIDA